MNKDDFWFYSLMVLMGFMMGGVITGFSLLIFNLFQNYYAVLVVWLVVFSPQIIRKISHQFVRKATLQNSLVQTLHYFDDEVEKGKFTKEQKEEVHTLFQCVSMNCGTQLYKDYYTHNKGD